MKTSVIIPNYNGISFLGDCLSTLEANKSSDFDFEIIVVDNGSDDGSAMFVKEKFPDVRITPPCSSIFLFILITVKIPVHFLRFNGF